MFSAKKGLALLVMVGASAIAVAQTQDGGTGTKAGAPGQPMCFGDGSGVQCPARNNGLPGHGCDNSWGQGGALLSAHGFASISGDSVELRVSGLPLDTTVVYLQAGKVMTPRPFHDGLMCLGGSLVQLGVQRPTDSMTIFPARGDRNLSELGRLPGVGGTVYYQVLYRDEGAFATRGHLNLSNGWMTVWTP